MAEELPFQKLYTDLFDKMNHEYIRLPNRAFKKSRTTPKYLLNFPDIMFPWGDRVYIREFGVMSGNQPAHNDRKKMQLERALKWETHGCVDVKMIFSEAEGIADLKNLGFKNVGK